MQILVSATGGDETHWRELVGEVEKLSLAFNIKSDWAISPTGTTSDLETIAKARDVVRADHPYVS